MSSVVLFVQVIIDFKNQILNELISLIVARHWRKYYITRKSAVLEMGLKLQNFDILTNDCV